MHSPVRITKKAYESVKRMAEISGLPLNVCCSLAIEHGEKEATARLKNLSADK